MASTSKARKRGKPGTKPCDLDGFEELFCSTCSKTMGHVKYDQRVAHHNYCHKAALINHFQNQLNAMKTASDREIAAKNAEIAEKEAENEILKVENALLRSSRAEVNQEIDISPILPTTEIEHLYATVATIIQDGDREIPHAQPDT